MKIESAVLLALPLWMLSLQAPARTPCELLTSLKLPNARTIVARDVLAGPNTFQGASGELPAFCRVNLLVEPQINIEVWLPAKERWNGRLRGEGSGGFDGRISYEGLADALRGGYATVSTDSGHQSYIGGAFALNADGSFNRQLIEDYAHRAVHEMTVKAKSLIKAYYGSAPRYSYFKGCSNGGRQGVMAAQRYPEDYDGVLAGCPALYWDRLLPSLLWPQIVMHQALSHPIDMLKLEAVTKAAVAACDPQDGVTDGLIADPRRCAYDPAAICHEKNDGVACLTAREAQAVRKIWEGPRSAQTGERLWFGLERGTPLGWLAGAQPSSIGVEYFQYWLEQDPGFDWRTITEEKFERSARKSREKFSALLGTDRSDLQRFAARGGKVILWHGETDEGISPRGSVRYFEQVTAAHREGEPIERFARLYLLPGIGHCIGMDRAPYPHGLFQALVAWVEKGVVPDHTLASQALPDGNLRTRPLCAYPKIAQWSGSGSTDEARNFTCVDGRRDRQDYSVVSSP